MAPGVAGGGRPRDGIGNRLKHGAISSRDWCTHAVPPFHAVASIWGRPLRPGWRDRGDDGVFVGQDRAQVEDDAVVLDARDDRRLERAQLRLDAVRAEALALKLDETRPQLRAGRAAAPAGGHAA